VSLTLMYRVGRLVLLGVNGPVNGGVNRPVDRGVNDSLTGRLRLLPREIHVQNFLFSYMDMFTYKIILFCTRIFS